MTNIQITYNPYTVKTSIILNDQEVDYNVSPLAYVQNKRLQEWIEPREGWKGIYKALQECTGEARIRIEFTGTTGDFDDMVYAKEKAGNCFQSIELVHKNKSTAKEAEPHQKMEKLKELYKELQEGPVEEFKTEDIRKNFDAAINSDFRIVVIAPMSSGKSTLINSMLGRDLLPAINQATTAVITEIKDNDDLDHFIVNADDRYGNNVANNEIASRKRISELNNEKDPNDPEKKEALIRTIKLEGPIPNLPSDGLSTVFVDTPGGNNSQNDEHEAMMDEAIRDENKSLILYVFNGAQLGTNDSNIILKKIAGSMKNSNNGKQSRDRFLFVANRMDEYDVSKEPYGETIENVILPQLASNGITEPNLFLVSAQAAKLVRMYQSGEILSEAEDESLDTFVKRFNRESRMLPQYASLNQSDKDKLKSDASQYMERGKGKIDPRDKNKLKAAEINSGVPALETAIKEYLEKYAIAIKIKTMHDTFMQKVHERQMIENCKKEWAETQENFEQIKNELMEKQEKYKKEEKLKEYKEKVDKIHFDKKIFLDTQDLVQSKLLSLQKQYNNKKEKSEFEEIYNRIKGTIEQIGGEAVDRLKREYDDGIKKSCAELYGEYSEYIENLRQDGFLKIGSFDMSQMNAYSAFNLRKADDLVQMSEYVSKERVKVGETKRKKRGPIAAIKRIFGSGGYENVDIVQDKEFVNWSRLMADEITAIQTEFTNRMKELINQMEENVEDLKTETKNKLNGLDKMIEKSMTEINGMLEDQEKLQKKVKENEDKTKWITEFVDKVDELLKV